MSADDDALDRASRTAISKEFERAKTLEPPRQQLRETLARMAKMQGIGARAVYHSVTGKTTKVSRLDTLEPLNQSGKPAEYFDQFADLDALARDMERESVEAELREHNIGAPSTCEVLVTPGYVANQQPTEPLPQPASNPNNTTPSPLADPARETARLYQAQADPHKDTSAHSNDAAGSTNGGAGNDKLYVGSGDDILDGSIGSEDWLEGGSGNDSVPCGKSIATGIGADVMYGNAAHFLDTFHFSVTNSDKLSEFDTPVISALSTSTTYADDLLNKYYILDWVTFKYTALEAHKSTCEAILVSGGLSREVATTAIGLLLQNPPALRGLAAVAQGALSFSAAVLSERTVSGSKLIRPVSAPRKFEPPPAAPRGTDETKNRLRKEKYLKAFIDEVYGEFIRGGVFAQNDLAELDLTCKRFLDNLYVGRPEEKAKVVPVAYTKSRARAAEFAGDDASPEDLKRAMRVLSETERLLKPRSGRDLD